MDKQERKRLRKEYKRAKRKNVTLWKTLCIISLVLAVVFIPLNLVLGMFDNTVAAFVGGTFWQLENEDPNAQYFKTEFATPEEMIEYGLTLTQQVEGEGAALLVNENKALPLAKGAAVSCFSTSSVNLVYGGTGSGNIDASTADNLRTALEKTGFSVNPTLWDFYVSGPGKDYQRKAAGMIATESATAAEAPWSLYDDATLASVADYGDAAIVVFSRVGGEGADLAFAGESNYLVLNQDEKDLLAGVTALKKDGKVQKVVVLINSANALQVDFLKDSAYDIDACLWIGDVGISGINAVAEILAGDINPSGSLVDTYAYDNFSAPAMWNFTPTVYEGYAKGVIPDAAKTYMVYQEGIYVGYRYYETRYEDTVMGTGNAGSFDYANTVAFPFGYGLSYTTFEYSDMGVTYSAANDAYTVRVTVKNTGAMAGKNAVQVYVQSPYTDYDRQNGVEKSAVALVGFAKTGLIEPGKSETVNITVDKRDIASYDTYGAGTYILDAGDYYLTAASDAHAAANNILAAKGYTKADGMTDAGDEALVYTWNEAKLDTTTYSTSKNGTAIVNRLSNADPNLYEGIDQEVVWLSRSDWEGTFPKETIKFVLNETLIADLQETQYDPADYEAQPLPAMGRDNGMKLVDMIGKDYDDPDWDTLLDQLTFDEMVALIGDSFHWRMPAKSIEAPGTRDENGPQGLTAALLGSAATQLKATAFTSEDVMAATFNTELMYEIGRVIANNCLQADIVCLYGPGNNTHRTPYGGRNFEYYSEDGFLAGKMSAQEVLAMQERGVDVVMKHFALNDSEQDRIGLGVWLNEQAAREIYLKAFQAPFEDGHANGVMTAYTRWGCIWSGGNKGLMTHIMREEWGNQGMSITDNVITTYVKGVDGVLAGVTTFDAMMPYINNELPRYKDDGVIVNAMREACHHNLYALANSSGMNGVGPNTTVKLTQPVLLTQLMILACAATFFTLLFAGLWIWGMTKFRKTEGYQNWKTAKRAPKV